MTAALQPCFQVSRAHVVVRADRGGIELLDSHAEEWRRLCLDAAEDQPFFHPEWIRAYLRTFYPKAHVLLITVQVGETLALILPLIEEIATFSKVPIRRLRVPVNSTSGRFDAVRKAGPDGDIAVRSTWEYLRALPGWDLLQFRDSLDGSTVGKLVELARADGFRIATFPDKPNPFIRIPSNPNSLQQLPPNSKLRSQLRQIRIRLQEHGRLKFLRTGTADRETLERFYRLEASGWKARTGSCVLKDGSRPFYDEVATEASRQGFLSLYSLELNGALVAAHMSLTHRDRCYSPKVAYNEDYKQFAPGHLIIAEILRDCSERGIRTFDITGQDQPWKMKWTSETRAVSHHFVFRGAMGALAHTVGLRLKRSDGIAWDTAQHPQGIRREVPRWTI